MTMNDDGASTVPDRREWLLQRGELTAVIRELGATLRALTFDGGDLIDGFGADEDPTSARGQVLAPWPNRLAGGSYDFEGRNGAASLNDPAHHAAIHGLVRELPFCLIQVSEDRLVLEVELQPTAAYPFSLRLRIEYRLRHDGLEVRSEATNIGSERCPFALGFHPYLSVGASLDSATLISPGRTVLEVDELLIPTGGVRDVAGTVFDFNQPRRIGDLVLDTAFTQLERDEAGRATVRLVGADGEPQVLLWLDSSFSYLQIFTGDTVGDPSRCGQSSGGGANDESAQRFPQPGGSHRSRPWRDLGGSLWDRAGETVT